MKVAKHYLYFFVSIVRRDIIKNDTIKESTIGGDGSYEKK